MTRQAISPPGLYVSVGALCDQQGRFAGGAEKEGQESIRFQEFGFKTTRRNRG